MAARDRISRGALSGDRLTKPGGESRRSLYDALPPPREVATGDWFQKQRIIGASTFEQIGPPNSLGQSSSATHPLSPRFRGSPYERICVGTISWLRDNELRTPRRRARPTRSRRRARTPPLWRQLRRGVAETGDDRRWTVRGDSGPAA